MAFTSAQQIALAVAPKVSGFLSLLGSTWIVIEVITQPTKRQNVYNRLLCAMSFFDLLNSSWMFASTWPIPSGTEGVVWAVGNEKTCIAQGFFIQAGIIPPIYNCCLAVYYLLVVKFGFSEERIRLKIEPGMHLLAISFGYTTATTGLFLDLYNNANVWCWMAPYPSGCQDSHYRDPLNGEAHDTQGTACTRGDDAWIYRWAFYFAPLWFAIAVVTVIMVSVYRTVRKREADHAEKCVIPSNDSSVVNVSSSVVKLDEENNTKRRSSVIKDRSELMTRGNSVIMPRTMADRYQSSRSLDRSNDAEHVLETIETYTTARHQNVEVNHFGSRAVFQQSLYYTMAFYMTYTFATINRLLQNVVNETFFPIIFLHSFFIPLQGFFNVLIYRYAFAFRLKQRRPEMGGWELIRLAWRWSFLGPPQGGKDNENRGSTLSTKVFSTRASTVTDAEKEAGVDAPRIEDASDEGNDLGMVNMLDDVLDSTGRGNGIYGMMADMMLSYSEFPNILADEDAVMFTAQYPTMIGQDSYTGRATPQVPQAYPNSIEPDES